MNYYIENIGMLLSINYGFFYVCRKFEAKIYGTYAVSNKYSNIH